MWSRNIARVGLTNEPVVIYNENVRFLVRGLAVVPPYDEQTFPTISKPIRAFFTIPNVRRIPSCTSASFRFYNT